MALAAILGLAFWLRWRFIHTVHLYPDEFITLLAIDMIKSGGLPMMPSGLFYEHGLLFSYLASLASLLDASYLTARYVSLLLGLMTIVLTFWAGRRWFSPPVGLIAAAALAIAPSAIHWSGRVRMYALLQLLVLLTVYLAYEGVAHNKRRLRWAALLTYLSTTLAHFAAVALAPPLLLASLVVLWVKRRLPSRAHRKPLVSPLPWRQFSLEVAAVVTILTIAFLVKRAGQPKGIAALESTATGAATGLVQVFSIYSDFSFNAVAGWQAVSPFYLNLPALIFTPLAIVGVVVGLAQLFKGQAAAEATGIDLPLETVNARLAVLFLSLVLVITTLEMILIVSADRRDDKYLFMLLPLLFLLGAYGIKVIGNWLLVIIDSNSSKPQLNPANHQLPLTNYQYLIGLTVIVFVSIITWPAVRSLLANTGDDYASAFAYVQEQWQPGDTIFTGTPAAAAFYLGRSDFYGVQRRGGYDYRILTIDDRPVDRWLASPAIRTEADLHRTLAENRVWLVLERWGLQREYYDPPFRQQLLAQTDSVAEAQGIFVLRSKADPQPIVLDPAHSVRVTFGEQIRLLGYTVEPQKPGSGQSLRLTLYWQAIAPVAHDYTVFVHLRRPEGGNVAQADHRPLGSLYPTSIWPVGETIRETSELPIPADLPPGDYELWTGLYLLETGERLPVQNDTSGENAVRLGRLSIE